LQQKDCNDKGVYLINSGLDNYGIKGRTNRPARVFPSNTITIDFWGNAFYRNFPYKMATHNHVFSLSGDIIKNEHVGIFLATQFFYMRQVFSFDNMGTWNKIKEMHISLPQTTEGEIDFTFMENFVRELEESRLRELEAYLLATGLNDYNLTPDDRSALESIRNFHWQEFKMGDLFERINTKKLPYKAKELPQQPTSKYTLPCLTSSFMNQGLNYYSPKDGATILSNVISIPSNSDVYRAYYQSHDFTVLSDAYAIRWKDVGINLQSNPYLFMVTCINKVTNLSVYSYKNKLGGWNVVKNKYITLPTTADGQPDIIAMERLITALQKIVIADVAKYTNRRLEATRQIVESTPVPYDTNDVSDYWLAAEPFECYKWNRFDQDIIDFFGGDKTILVGCYKGKKHYDWIRAHNIYNIRLGKTKGSMEEKHNLFGNASLLVLYEYGKPNKLSAYKIVDHQEMSKEDLLEMDYPKERPRKSYMTFSITPADMDLESLINHRFIEKLIEIDSANTKGTPVFIEP
jgi:hypothetical protein